MQKRYTQLKAASEDLIAAVEALGRHIPIAAPGSDLETAVNNAINAIAKVKQA